MEKVEVNLLELGGKARSKSELYRLLTAEGHLYLPPYKTCPIDFIADIIQEKKMVSKYWNPAGILSFNRRWSLRMLLSGWCPMWQACELRTFWNFSLKSATGRDFFQENTDGCFWAGTGSATYVYTRYSLSIGNSINSEGFNVMVENKLKERQVKLIKSNSFSILAPKRFANLFTKSLMISSKISWRIRSPHQMHMLWLVFVYISTKPLW